MHVKYGYQNPGILHIPGLCMISCSIQNRSQVVTGGSLGSVNWVTREVESSNDGMSSDPPPPPPPHIHTNVIE